MREFVRKRQASFVLLFVFVLAASACKPSLQEISNEAESQIRLTIQKDAEGKSRITLPQEAPKPMLVVDVTLSMAGYFAPPEQRATQFSEALDILSGALPGYDLYTFGGGPRARPGEPLERLLTNQPAGIGRIFYRDEIFTGQFNQDHLLFEAAGRQARPRPLVFVTDGVYSTPQGNGTQPVVQALNKLLNQGWSLGVIALRSAYYGTRCDLLPGRPCSAGQRLFFSEARSQRGMTQFVPMPPCAIADRPFYIVVLAPTSGTFKALSAKFAERLHPEATFLIAGNAVPVTVKKVKEFASEGEELPEVYGGESGLKWLMFKGGKGVNPKVSVEYSVVVPEFPVEGLGWDAKADQTTWGSSGFEGEWISVPSGEITLEPAETPVSQEEEPFPARLARLPWNGFDREIRELQASFQHIHTMGDLAERNSASVQQIEGWHPTPSELGPLYCEYLNPFYRSSLSERFDMLRILLAVDALRRQRPDEASGYLASFGPSPVTGPYLGQLARDLKNFSPQSTVLARGLSLPAGQKPVPAVAKPSADVPASDGGRIILRFAPPAGTMRTYRIRLVPRSLYPARSLAALTTDDDSDIAFADRTYRLGTLIESLAAAQLERIGSRGDLTIYVTIPGS